MKKQLFGAIDALQSLRPGTEATIDDNDYKTVRFIKPLDNPPTEEEIVAEIARLNSAYEAEQANREVRKLALLDRLGITADEAKLLLG